MQPSQHDRGLFPLPIFYKWPSWSTAIGSKPGCLAHRMKSLFPTCHLDGTFTLFPVLKIILAPPFFLLFFTSCPFPFLLLISTSTEKSKEVGINAQTHQFRVYEPFPLRPVFWCFDIWGLALPPGLANSLRQNSPVSTACCSNGDLILWATTPLPTVHHPRARYQAPSDSPMPQIPLKLLKLANPKLLTPPCLFLPIKTIIKTCPYSLLPLCLLSDPWAPPNMALPNLLGSWIQPSF